MSFPKPVLVADVIAYHDHLDLMAHPAPIAITPEIAELRRAGTADAMSLLQATQFIRQEQELYRQKQQNMGMGVRQGIGGGILRGILGGIGGGL